MNRVLVWLWDEIDRHVLALTMVEFGFVVMFIIGLVEAMPGLAFFPLLAIALFAALLTRRLAESGIRKIPQQAVLFAGGLVVVFGFAARLYRPVSVFIGRFWLLEYQQTIPGWLQRYSGLQNAAGQIALNLNTFFTNMAVWWQNLWAGTAIDLVQPALFIWGLVLYGIVVWYNWYLHHNSHPVIATVPGMVVMAASVEGSNNAYFYFALAVSIGVIVWALFTQAKREMHWDAQAFGYSEELRLDIGGAAFFVAILVFGIIVLRPTFSVREIADKIDEWTRSDDRSGGAISGSGVSELRPRDDRVSRTGALPNSHLLTDPPELRSRLLFEVKVVDYRQEGPPADLYWRTRTFDTYTGDGWLVSQVYPQEFAAFEEVWQNTPDSQDLTELQILLRADDARGVLIYANRLVSADRPVTIFWRENAAGVADMFLGMIEAEEYAVWVARPDVRREVLREDSPAYAEWVRETYLQLPESLPDRVTRLGEEIVRGYSDPYTMAMAIENFLRQYKYDLEIPLPPGDTDIVDHFLFELQSGYCDYYASAMVVLVRSVGIPARMVVGYARGAYHPDRDTFSVTGEEAHSWVEVYFNGIGWVEFEPTAGRPPVERDALTNSFEPALLPPEPPPSPRLWLFDRLLSLPNILLLIGVLVLGFAAFERIWFSSKTKVDLLMKIKLQLYQLASQFEVPDPSTQTLLEIKTRVDHKIDSSFHFLGLRRLGEKVHRLISRNLDLLAQVAYQGKPPRSLLKSALVNNVIAARRALFLLKTLKFWWKRARH